jgi:tetratricopeptide (TPR) repeat protein
MFRITCVITASLLLFLAGTKGDLASPLKHHGEANTGPLDEAEFLNIGGDVPENYYQNGKYAQSVKYCTRGLSTTGNKPTKSQVLAKASLLRSRAKAYMALHEYVKALSDWDAALALDPSGSLDVYKAKAECFRALKNAPKAIDFYTKILRRFSPLEPRLFIQLSRNRAILYSQMHKYEEAMQDVDGALLTVASYKKSKLSSEVFIAKSEEVKLMYLRAKINAARGKTSESEQDRARADKLANDM